MQKLAWGKKVDGNFRARLDLLISNLQWAPKQASDLMACMAFESAETFSPSIKNAAGSGAVGLIQFMPLTAQSLGTTTAELALMSAVQQLDFVEAYFRPYARRIKNLPDMYMAILLPAYVGASDDTIIIRAGGVTYRQNAGLDWDKDGTITKAEASALVRAKLEKGMQDAYAL